MEDQIKKVKMSMRASAVIVIISCSTLVITHRLDTIRAVDFIQIFGAGIAFGVMLVSVFMLKRLRSQNNK